MVRLVPKASSSLTFWPRSPPPPDACSCSAPSPGWPLSLHASLVLAAALVYCHIHPLSRSSVARGQCADRQLIACVSRDPRVCTLWQWTEETKERWMDPRMTTVLYVQCCSLSGAVLADNKRPDILRNTASYHTRAAFRRIISWSTRRARLYPLLCLSHRRVHGLGPASSHVDGLTLFGSRTQGASIGSTLRYSMT